MKGRRYTLGVASIEVGPGAVVDVTALPRFSMSSPWLLVGSGGFLIESLTFGNTEVLRDVSDGLFTCEAWDEIEAVTHPWCTRLALAGYDLHLGNVVHLRLLNWGVEPRAFRGALVAWGNAQ